MVDNRDLIGDVSLIEDSMALARAVLLQAEHITVDRKRDGSLVTPFDGAVQDSILGLFRNRLVTDTVLAEESNAEDVANYSSEQKYGLPGRWWAIDPIDGTSNFASSIPSYCVSIGLCRNRVPSLGAILDVPRNEIYRSWTTPRQDWPHCSSLSQIRFGLEYEGPAEGRVLAGTVANRLIPEVEMFRVIGSAAMGLAWVASGRLDAFFHPHLSPWDYAAGFALVRSAGGRISSPTLGDRADWVLAGSPSGFALLEPLVRSIIGENSST